MKKLLCKPCAKDLEARGKTVKPAGGRCEKITCAECGHRRFGIQYDVTGWPHTLEKGGQADMSRRTGKRIATMDPLEKIRKAAPVIALVLAIVALIVSAVALNNSEKAREAAKATRAAVIFTVEQGPTDTLLVGDAWEFAALYRAAEDPADAQRIGEALEALGYFSAAVPLSWEYQDYMRTYCHLYGCPYPLALAVADWETRGRFNMDAAGPAGEVGIFQLNPGPDGAYHAELEAATGLDPATPEGNIAGGCYLLGKYMAWYEDETMTAMAYNLGQAGARRAWAAGITSTEYTDAVLAALEMWECAVNAWAGE